MNYQIIVALICFCIYLLWKLHVLNGINIKFTLNTVIDKLTIKNYEIDTKVMCVELKNIMGLNKLCIEKWEKAILENVNLNQSNFQLIEHVRTLEKKKSS